MNSPINYYGSKAYAAKTLISFFPNNYSLYVEGFGGGASVLFHKKRDTLEVYNDLGENIWTLFHVLQDRELFEELKSKFDLSLYSAQLREEFKRELDTNKKMSLVERAFKYLYVNRTSFNGVGGFSINLSVRRNMSKSTSDFLSMIDGLPEIHERLSSVIIEHKDIQELIDKYDDEDVFFFLDPPYVHDTRSSNTVYEREMSNSQHIDFVDRLLAIKGKALVCGYNHSIYDKLVDNGWSYYEYESPNSMSNNTESLWYNYNLEQGDIFDV